MIIMTVQMRVTSVRSRGAPGGVIFAGVTAEEKYLVALCSHELIPDSGIVDKGQHWTVSGTMQFWNDEQQIKAISAEMLRPSGRNIIDWIVRSSDCAGIGPVKAAKLYERFGPELVDRILAKDVASLKQIVTEEAADLLCRAFEKHQVADTLLWLDRLAIDRRLGKKLVEFYTNQARAKIEENPYRLISFTGVWKNVDEIAQRRFGIALDDPRRLDAAVEEALYAGMRDGHTCMPRVKVKERLCNLLGDAALAGKALALDTESTQYKHIGDILQSAGMAVIEKYIADRLREIATVEGLEQQALWTAANDEGIVVDDVLMSYEQAQGFHLTAEQRSAVVTSTKHNLSLILGGAGTGKTTVLKALYKVLTSRQDAVAIYQIALAGRAAQRMSEATGRESMTIAAFLNKVNEGMLGGGTVVVVDEMSMVDVILMYRLLRHIPLGVKLILVGDPSQLPPIGPGLILHALAGNPNIPQTVLKVTKRQSVESGIPAVATAIREHQVPQFTEYVGKGSGVSFVACRNVEIEQTVYRIYQELGGDGASNDVQILSITKAHHGGTLNINTALHNSYRHAGEPVYAYDEVYGQVGARTLERIPLKQGDLVMFTENDYELGLRNGSLGVVTGVADLRPATPDAIACTCDFEGVLYELNSKQVEALCHAYAITVHKSQGSQFRRVIVPIRQSKLLDQTLIYTAVTRGVEQVILVGDLSAAMTAIKAPPSAARRHVSLPLLLRV